MLTVTLVTDRDELVQIVALNKKNLKQNITAEEKAEQGFVSWCYPLDLLEKMHSLSPSVIVKDGDKVVAYALTTTKEARTFHPDLNVMFQNMEPLQFNGKNLLSYHFYCMGQICVDKDYRGRGLVNALYQKHKEVYSSSYEFLLTEISTANHRSVKAHQKVGFETIHTYKDAVDEWNVVIWRW